MTFTDQVNNVDLSDNPSTCELFRAFNAISQLLSDTPASQSPIFLITQQPPSDIDMEEKVIKQAVSWNARIFVIYIVPKAFQCPLDDFQPLVRLTQATNGQFIMIETNPDPKVFTSIMDTQFNSQTLNAAVADKCVLSLRVNRNPAGSPIYLAISASGSVPLMANGVLQSPLASADQNWRFFDLPTGTTSVEINATLIPCNVIIYTIASTSLFISFSNDNSVDTYAPYLIEGVPLSVTLHAELASSISATVDSAQFNLVASNGSNLATVPGEQRSNCSYEWIADMPACDRGNSKFLLHIDLQLTNGQMISRVFGVYCATMTQSTPTITDKINSVLSITPMTNLMSESVVRLYILVFFGKNCGKTVVVTPDPDLFLDELKKAGNMTDVVCANGKPSATLQDAIIMAVAYLGPQKAFAYAILTSDVSQISDPSDVYSALQGVDLTLNIATLTPTPSEDALKVMQAVASATGGALFIFDSSAAPLQLYPHLRNTFVRLLSDLASTALYKIVKFDGENTPFSVESTYTELIVTYIDAGGGSGSIEIEPFDNTNSFTIVKDKYTTVMQFKTSNTTALNTVVPRTNCNYHAGCILIIQVIGGEQAVVRFTDLCDSDFPTARAVAGQSINAIVYLRDALADDGIHMLNLASGDLQRQTSVDYKNRTGCTFAYVATLTNLSPTSNWLVITGEEPSRSTFTKYIPFVIVDKLRCNNGGTLSENKCQCLPGWSEPDCSQVNCGREGTPNSQMTACTCLQNGFTGRFCDKSVTPSTTSTTSSTTTNPSSVSSTTAAISTTTTVTTSVTTSISTTTTTQTPLLSTTTTTTKSAEGLSTGVIVAIIVVGVLGLVGMAAAIGIALLLKSGSSGMAHGPSTGHGKGQRMWRSRGRMQRNPSQPRRNDGPSLGNGSQVGLWPWNGASGIQY
uniref:EGF-like domain-containing protein n=1 Tax=Plectus sambesii TaxID=2011161 RepID=A0A914UMP5_9BILA